ncbi:MAG: ATP-binding protein [Eubacterium sp.]
MVNKTFTKILSLGLGIVVVTSLLTVLVFHSYYEKQAQSNLKSIATLVSAEINSSNDYSFINDSYNDDTRLTVIDANGNVLADSAEDATKMESHADRPEFKEAIDNGQGSTIRKSATIDQNTYYYAIRLDNGNVLRVAVTSDSVYMVFYQSLFYIAIVSLAVMLLSLAISVAVTKSIVKPITELGNNLDSIDEQNTVEELTPFVNALSEYKQKQKLLDKQKKEFTANVSHELKTPLTSIAGYAELIENGMAKPEDIKPFAHTIRKQALRLVTLTEDIIQLSQLEETQPESISFEEVNLAQIAERCAESLEMNARAKNVNITLDTEDCYINGNTSLLEELVYNLIDNAIRYNKENGSVEIKTRNRSIIVSDTGIGIPQKYQSRIFERFFRVDKSRSKETGGTGLGLAIVKHIAEVHGAEISISSVEDVGTTIQVDF